MRLLRNTPRTFESVSPNRSSTSSWVYFRGGLAVPTETMRGPAAGRRNAALRGETMRWTLVMVSGDPSGAPGGEPVELPRVVRPEVSLDAPRQVAQAVAQAALQEDVGPEIEEAAHRLVPAQRVPQVPGRFVDDVVGGLQDVLGDARHDAAVRRAHASLGEEPPDLGLGVAE